jgi:ribonuclease HII
MKKVNCITLTVIGCLLATFSIAQNPFSNCAAAFLDQRMVVESYSPTAKCAILESTTGELTVCTANISETITVPVDKIKFKIAIKDQKTGTLTMFSDQTYKNIAIQKVLAKCKKGDSIVLLTMNNEYALPHNEIVVQ